ncbi:o-succinylbenzoate synthase [Jejuia pallidilutea]|uniref:O-succinylbenzoate synthase n=2 Tax=Jejuia pallidilutea TaxID=504487 RepID=A0A362X8D5_9FLAO|nr:o-succinylbenzoate synthase [Jejuia pallidilutea]
MYFCAIAKIMHATYKTHTLKFKTPSGTSRGVLNLKETWIITLKSQGKEGIGECGMFKGLSVDDRLDFETKLQWACNNIHLGLQPLLDELIEFPSIQFGLEMAFLSLHSQNNFELFPSEFTNGNASIPINGLIWMGSETFMKQQIKDKINAGFNCIKMKIGAIDFKTEIDLLKSIRKEFTSKDIELRVDANGAFAPHEALEKLKILSEFHLHSIEQPIKQGQVEAMAKLCEVTPLPIALDEELIGIFSVTNKLKLLQTIRPQYIILKPTLVGGFKGSDTWIQSAENNNIGWWITSALESNIGLNAIAQYTFMQNSKMPQGLGTGGLFTNNFESPLYVSKGHLHYDSTKNWEINL